MDHLEIDQDSKGIKLSTVYDHSPAENKWFVNTFYSSACVISFNMLYSHMMQCHKCMLKRRRFCL